MPQENPTHIDKISDASDGRIRIDGGVSQHLRNINGHDTHLALESILTIMNNFGIHKLKMVPMKKEDKTNPEVGGVSSDGAATLTRISSISKTKTHKSSINNDDIKSPFLEDWSVDLTIEVNIEALNDSYSLADVLMMKGIDNSIQLEQMLEHMNCILRRGLLEGSFQHNFKFPYQLVSERDRISEMYILSNSIMYLPILCSMILLIQQRPGDIISFMPTSVLAYFMTHFGHLVRSRNSAVSRHDVFPGTYPIINVLLGTIRTLKLKGFEVLPHIDDLES